MSKFFKTKPPEEGPKRTHAQMRGWTAPTPADAPSRARRKAENAFILEQYKDAVTDAKAEGKLTQKRINERMGL